MDAAGEGLHNTFTMPDDLATLHFNQMPRCTAVIDKHFEGYWTIQLKTAGAAYLAYDQRWYDLAGAWVWPCYPGPRIRFGPARPGGWWHHRYIALLGPCVARWQTEGLWLREPQPLTGVQVRSIARAFDRLLDLAGRSDHLGRMRTINLLESILIELAEARRGGGEDQTPRWLRTAMARLEDLDADEPDYDQLADAVNMSISSLRRRFKAATGHALHTYRLQCRIAAARRLLGDTDLPIKHIADRLGYRDVFYFTRQFGQQVGLPPATYRRSRQG